MNSASQRVVVTGLGVQSSVGSNVDSYWDALLRGVSGIAPIQSFDASELKCRIAGEVRDLDITRYISPKEAKRLDRFTHLAIAGADEAVDQSGIRDLSTPPERIGVLVGCGVGGLHTMQEQAVLLHERGPGRASPLMVPMMIIDMAAGYLSIRYGFTGPNAGMVTACASGAHAIGEAAWIIHRGDADVMVTGGVEAPLCMLGLAGFCSMKALSTRNDEPERASRPFDAERDGFVPAEGAGILVLESLEHARRRGARILAELVGYGATGDAYHITAPRPDGEGAYQAIRMALRHAELAPEDVSYVNAHGTSTPLNDKVETLSLKRALGDRAYTTPISSIKSMIGHALGAAGGLESVACVLSLRDGVVPGTMNYENPDPDCDLDYVPNQAREVDVRVALNINLGFGGHNSAILFRRWDG
jgi:3-oxoacyl-[acyl-carrier-protein] synthase II